jgi:GH25 family lysozyme M1 (1,4-beta-N-acetylmuramidase)
MRFTSAKLRGLAAVLAVLLLMSLGACRRTEYIDPHAGMVLVADGRGGEMWVPLHEELPAANFSAEDFSADGSYIDYAGIALRGIDVSEHQGEIDWQAVREDGVEFAIIRAGYRGYSEGLLYEDEFFRANIAGAQAAGLKVGVYFFSQAVNTAEAAEEADFLLGIIDGYALELPVFFDWELVAGVGETRADKVDGQTVTDCCLAFSAVVESAGYRGGVYFYRSLGYYDYELDRLTDLVFWVGAPGDAPDFYYKHAIWQYSFTGAVGGIAGGTDLNLLFETALVEPSKEPVIAIPPEVTLPQGG